MFKAFERMLCPVLALAASGVIGCKPEKTRFDVFHPPAPRVVRGAEVMTMGTWDRGTNRELDFHDAFDFTEAQAASVTVISRCMYRGISLVKVSEVLAPKWVRIISLLPTELLNADVYDDKLTCNFETRLANSFGSRHIFIITDTVIIDSAISDVTIDNQNIVRFDTVKPAVAQVICTDMFLPAVKFEFAIDMKEFNFEAKMAWPSRDEGHLEIYRHQTCRIAIVEAELITALSKKFDYVIPQTPLFPSTEWHSPSDLQAVQEETYLLGEFFNLRQPKRLLTVKLSNTTSFKRRIKIPKGPLPANYEVYGVKDSQYVIGNATRNGIVITPTLEPGGSAASDLGDDWMILIDPNQSVRLEFFALPPGGQCFGVGMVHGFLLSPAQPIAFEEVDPNGTKLGEIGIDFGPKVIVATRGDTLANIQSAAQVNPECRW